MARDQHVLAVCRYIDLNPVRAGIVDHACDYRWSSYSALAGLRVDTLVTPHATLDQLGSPRGAAYAQWCAEGIGKDELDRRREATFRELAFGSNGFRAELDAQTARATSLRALGRPRNAS